MIVKTRLPNIRLQNYLMSKKDFSKMIDVNEQQYCRYEQYSLPSLPVALKISRALNLTVNEIWQIED